MPRRRVPDKGYRRDLVEDFAGAEEEGGYNAGRRRTGLRLTFHGGLPQSVWGRIAAGVAFLCICAVAFTATVLARRLVLRDQRFVLQGSDSILTQGNHHLSREHLLDVFRDDVERNILRVSLADRKAELEQIPWVKRATVMRLLPDRISVSVEERTPVAFARQGTHISLVDAGGVVLDMRLDKSADPGYSFPVVTGISPDDPLSVRAARMKIFHEFTGDLDASGEQISAKMSEVDLSNPEDVKALIADHGADVLVHFGDRDYLDRYRRYEAHLSEWRAQYPKLSSVDMRYERQVVLEMQAGTAVPLAGQEGKLGEMRTSVNKAPSPSAHTSAKSSLPHQPVHSAATAKAHPDTAVKAGPR